MRSKVIISSLLIFMILFGSTTSAAMPKQAKVSLLFVIEAAHGSLKHTSGKKYQLSIPVRDVKNILAFSDRPHRMAFKMTPQEYQKQTYTGAESFAKKPPNLVLTWGHQLDEAAAYELLSYKQKNGRLVYELLYIGPKDNQVDVPQTGKLALFIDSYHLAYPDHDQDIIDQLKDPIT
jgi:hypothetical protein